MIDESSRDGMNDAVRSSDSTDSISGSRISGRIAEELQFAILSGVLAEGTLSGIATLTNPVNKLVSSTTRTLSISAVW